ncbi:hypothetical protein ARSEF1564_003658 [Beauveria bassiana]
MTRRSLLSGPITFTDAKARSVNILHALQYPSQKEAFYRRIEGHRALLAEVVAHHLGIKTADVDISPQEYWRHGSFNLCVNLCVPVGFRIDYSAQPHVPKHVLIRFPLPYRVGEAEKPGNSDEKLNCEAATLPRIGSFRLDSKGYLHLVNQPLSVQHMMHEDEGYPLDIPRNTAFLNVKELVLYCLTAFDNRLLSQPNSITSRHDALAQMSGLTVAKTIFPQLFRRELANGLFVLTLTDLHKSNIFVNKDWEITCIIDLEFACSLPVEFLESPSCWLEDGLVHKLAVDDFAPKYAEFIEHLRHEEQLQNCQESKKRFSSIMEQMWENGTFWFTLALKCPIAFNEILFDRILPSYFGVAVDELREADYSLAALAWGSNISGIIDRKLQDQEEYQKKLHQAFTD